MADATSGAGRTGPRERGAWRGAGDPAVKEDETLEAADRRHIIAALERTNWVIAGPNGAASRLGIKRSTLQFRMRKLGIVRPTAQH